MKGGEEMNTKLIYNTIAILLMTLLLLPMTEARTTCETKDCAIKITIYIAYSGATDQQISDWTNDIESVWNGSGQITGDCQCPITFKVETVKITDPAQINCNPGPPGYHCVMVTSYATNPPKDTSGDTYIAYMYPPGVALNGQSLKGWWSDQMNKPAPTGGIYHDAAHEAGHMLGLFDGEDTGIMTNTSGPNAKPTQFNIDAAANEICGSPACPFKCCCGNGLIDKDKGEGCDPMATPSGCGSNSACCSVCCNCFTPICDPKKGQYATEAGCEAACTGDFSKCYKNYKTGCWDCVKLNVVEHKRDYQSSIHLNFDHLKQLEGYDFSGNPLLCISPDDYLAVNIYVENGDLFSMTLYNCIVEAVYNFPMPFVELNALINEETKIAIENGEKTVEQAFTDGSIIFEPAIFEP